MGSNELSFEEILRRKLSLLDNENTGADFKKMDEPKETDHYQNQYDLDVFHDVFHDVSESADDFKWFSSRPQCRHFNHSSQLHSYRYWQHYNNKTQKSGQTDPQDSKYGDDFKTNVKDFLPVIETTSPRSNELTIAMDQLSVLGQTSLSTLARLSSQHLSQEISSAYVKSLYRKAVRKTHPDLNQGQHEAFLQVKLCYDVLKQELQALINAKYPNPKAAS